MVKKNDEAMGTEEVASKRAVSKRKKVYERIRETEIPEEITNLFKKDNYDLKLVRWSINGEEDYRYLHRREQEGYEFVKAEELPAEYLRGMNIQDSRSHKGLITIGDLCLMKIDTDLRNSRRKAFEEITQKQMDAVDIHVLEKKGFKNLGTRSKVTMREPSFQE